MAKQKNKKAVESDSAYFLKLVMYLIMSSMWLRLSWADGTELPLPLGAFIALIFVTHEHFQIDRKIEFALILVGMFISFWLPIGLYIVL